ncbi:hypothetical protein SLS58_010914 [Diplodia intermedia]|uniref:Fork-head domain-containing protein n=1 Tax=Diplodia intermedia TaxID=856260 RepID=A0ABR3T3G3_9PEZI
MPYQLQVTINGQVHVLPASVLTEEGTQAVINMMAAQSPPQNRHRHQQLLHSEQHLAPSGPEAATNDLAWFTAAELAGMANGVFPQPEDDRQQQERHQNQHHQPAAIAALPPPPHLTTTTTTTPPPPPRRSRNSNTTNTPPHFPGYRWVAQSIALQSARATGQPAVQLGTIYSAMGAMWPDHFSTSSASSSWKSGVRHAVLKHFKRVDGGVVGGVWYQPDPENMMTAEEARRVVGGRGRVRGRTGGRV